METRKKVVKLFLFWSLLVLHTTASFPTSAQTSQPNSINIPDPGTATAVELATRLNSLTPQAVPQETVIIGVFKVPPHGLGSMRWAFPTREASPVCPQSGGSLAVIKVPAPIIHINSFNERYQILIEKPPGIEVKASLAVPTLAGWENFDATLQPMAPGTNAFAPMPPPNSTGNGSGRGGPGQSTPISPGVVATIDFHPRTFGSQRLSISYSGGSFCSTIVPNMKPQLGAFVIPYLPISILYQPSGCGQCPTGQCGSYASYMNGTKIGTTLSWGTSATAGTIQTVDSGQFVSYLSQGAAAASAIAQAIPGGAEASDALEKMGKAIDFLGKLSDTQQITTTTQTQGHTEARGWTISYGEGAHTDACQSDDLFVYLKDVIFMYAVLPKDPVSGNITPSGIPTVILTPYYYKERRLIPYSQLQSQLPAGVAEQFRALDLRMNPGSLQQELSPSRSRLARPRLIASPQSEECPSLPGGGTNDVTLQQEHFSTSATSESATTTTLTNNSGLLASILNTDPGSHGPGQTTQSVTYSSAVTNWQSSSIDAGLHLKCPEYYPGAPGLQMDVYLDNLFGTLLAVPIGPETNQPPIAGAVTAQSASSVANQEVLLTIGATATAHTPTTPESLLFDFLPSPKVRERCCWGAGVSQSVTRAHL